MMPLQIKMNGCVLFICGMAQLSTWNESDKRSLHNVVYLSVLWPMYTSTIFTYFIMVDAAGYYMES